MSNMIGGGPHNHHFVRLEVAFDQFVTIHLHEKLCYCDVDEDEEGFRDECVCSQCIQVWLKWAREEPQNSL